VARRRLRRKAEKAQRHARQPNPASAAPLDVVLEAERVERLAYTRTQAAQALGVSRSTFDRRVLPHVATLEMPWGAKLIPVDELERLLAERRRPPQARRAPRGQGRPAAVPDRVVEWIRGEAAAGKSLSQIAVELNEAQVVTAHGGRRWWTSTVRAVLLRSGPLDSA
jgi:hypothetical protein